jgi:HAD superfamily hydrolase (TIGR01509 family)
MVAVIFDMDGVIVDSERYWEDEQEHILSKTVETADVSPDDVRGMNVLDQYDYLTDEYTVAVTKDEYFALYDDRAEAVYGEKVDLLFNVQGVVTQLTDDGATVAVASSSFRDWIQTVMERFDLEDAFAAVVSAEDIDGRSKPAPDIYLYTADQIGADPSDCVVVEDSVHGIHAAKEAGTHCVAFCTEMNADCDLSDADLVVDGAEDLQAFFADGRYRDLISG